MFDTSFVGIHLRFSFYYSTTTITVVILYPLVGTYYLDKGDSTELSPEAKTNKNIPGIFPE